MARPSVQLYDLEDDPDEMINLAGKVKHNDRVEQLTNVLVEHLIRHGASPGGFHKPRTSE